MHWPLHLSFESLLHVPYTPSALLLKALPRSIVRAHPLVSDVGPEISGNEIDSPSRLLRSRSLHLRLKIIPQRILLMKPVQKETQDTTTEHQDGKIRFIGGGGECILLDKHFID